MTIDHTSTRAIDADALDTIFHDAATAYAFTDEPVTDAELDAVYALANLGPTALNAQPLRVVYVRDEAKARILPHISEFNRAKCESAPVVAVLAYDADFHEHLPRVLPMMANAKDNFADPEGRTAFALNNAWLAAGYFIIAARALGLDAGPMTGFTRTGMDAELFGESTWRSFMVVNLGHVAEGGSFPRKPRVEYADAVRYL